MKLRASWGQNGSIAGLGDYMYGSVINSTIKYPIEGNGSYEIGSLPSSTGNYNLKWETSEQLNVGLDLRMFKDRFSFTMDWYKKKTKDLIMTGVKSSLSVGNTISPLNAGNVENSGFEGPDRRLLIRNQCKPCNPQEQSYLHLSYTQPRSR